MTAEIRVIVVDDHPLLRAGVSKSLEESGLFAVVGQGATADDAVRLVNDVGPDVVLLDLSMPGGGLSAARRIRETVPGISIVVLTVSEADDDVLAALRAGANGYVLKGIGSAALVDIVQGIASGESYVSPSLAARLLTELGAPEQAEKEPENLLSSLTKREEEILRLVSKGSSNKEIGLKLELQEKTVKHHMTHILSKLHVRNRTQAAMILHNSTMRRT